MLDTSTLSRAQLRRHLRGQRRALSRHAQHQAAQGLYKQLAQHPLFRRATQIALYLPNDGEIDPRPLLRSAVAPALDPTLDPALDRNVSSAAGPRAVPA